MKESTLKVLVQLFALVANVNKGRISHKAEEILLDALKRIAAEDQVSDFLQLFRNYLNEYHKVDVEEEGKIGDLKKRSSQSVKALVICEYSNSILEQHEKIRIISRLLEFANEDGYISKKEKDFLKTVKDSFNISDKEYNDIYFMVLSPWIQGIQKERLILVDKNEMEKAGQVKHLTWNGLEGQLIALYIRSANFFMFKYYGTQDLYKNASKIHPGVVEFLDLGSFIKSPSFTPIYFSTLTSRYFQGTIKGDLEYQAADVEYKFQNSENGVQKFTFKADAGELIGIVGGSGVGKSTLLNVLNGSLVPKKGKIYINGYDLHKYHEKLEGIIGYIPQDDLLIDDLTVFQNLYYNAKLCFSEYSEIQILKSVIRLLKDLDLYEIRYLKVGNPLEKYISGGQRKRLNIGLELLREPLILFVDEPTSGLSSRDAEKVMRLLKRQTFAGKIALVNIHQPSSDIFKLFNRILVMDKGGHMIFQGDPLDALVYFKTENNQLDAKESQCTTCGNVNPEQVLEIVESTFVNKYGRFTDIRKFTPKEWYDKYQKKTKSQSVQKPSKIKLPEIHFKVPDLWNQFKVFVARDVKAKLVNKQYMLITFLESPLLAVIIGYFTKYFSGSADNPDEYVFKGNDNMVSYLFMSVIVALFLGMIVSAEEIIKDARILKRESFLNLSRFSYINSKVFIVLTISAVQVLSFVIIGNYMLEIKGMTFKYWMILFSAASLANMLGLNISTALKSVASIYIVIPLLLVPQILFSGTVVPFDKLRSLKKHSKNVPLIGDIMTSRWAFEALAVNQFKNNKFEKNFFDLEMQASVAMYKTAFLFPKIRGLMDEAKRLKAEGTNRKRIENNLKVVRNEINDLKNVTGIHPGNVIRMIDPEYFTPTVKSEVENYLDSLQYIYQVMNNRASTRRDEIYNEVEVQVGGKSALLEFQDNYANTSISNLVLNRNQLQKIIEIDDHLVQRMDPIFEKPDSRVGRAHMFAPIKRIGRLEIETYWFNLQVIWFMSLVAYLVLYFNLLQRFATAVNAFRMRRLDRMQSRIQLRRKMRGELPGQ